MANRFTQALAQTPDEARFTRLIGHSRHSPCSLENRAIMLKLTLCTALITLLDTGEETPLHVGLRFDDERARRSRTFFKKWLLKSHRDQIRSTDTTGGLRVPGDPADKSRAQFNEHRAGTIILASSSFNRVFGAGIEFRRRLWRRHCRTSIKPKRRAREKKERARVTGSSKK